MDTEGQGRSREAGGARPHTLHMGVAPDRNRVGDTVCQHTPTEQSLDRAGPGVRDTPLQGVEDTPRGGQPPHPSPLTSDGFQEITGLTVCYTDVDGPSVRFSVSVVSAPFTSSTERPSLRMSNTPSAVAAGTMESGNIDLEPHPSLQVSCYLIAISLDYSESM
ncbi:unnamed protein product [Danaus chrysippus]|uniref:(African queen) hypothetical protein n=1 Tax=Danaus chrysippus TaxID=151541 RepID=A0A8J2QF56_9NEOP|nr:unnamed protein product [Danaus chrysippus]